MRGTYAAAFEGHQTLWYLDKLLRLSATLRPELRLPAHAVEVVRTVLSYGLGNLRQAYPDKVPPVAWAATACPAGPGSCGPTPASRSDSCRWQATLPGGSE